MSELHAQTTAPSTEPDALIAPPFGLSRVHTGPEANRKVEWWRKARFGMFIHFGVYAVPGRGEWVMWNESIPHREYAKFADEFKPSPDAPKAWAALAKEAGMKYVVMTARHHDGFSLFDSKANDFNSMRTAAHQDVVRTFCDAVRGQNLRVGLYYSPLDWRFPGYFFPDLYLESAEAMRAQYHAEIEQLARDYGHLDLLWYDGGGEDWLGFGGIESDGKGWKTRDHKTPYHGKFNWQDDAANAKLRELQPNILINDRTSTPGDWRTREGAGAMGSYQNAEPWELCLTLAGAWGYQPNAKPRSFDDLVLLLTRTASRDGNLLLNIGPAPDGHVPADQVTVLKQLGTWLQTHGDTIYDTRGGPFLPTANVSATRRDRTIFLHVVASNGAAPTKVVLPRFPNGPTLQTATLFIGKTPLDIDRKVDGSAELTVPRPEEGSPTTIVELSYDGPVMNVAAMELPSGGK
ncbi:MAG: alpha-L-fucosidase [Tepidisphaeraceae bacterium]